RVRLAALYDVRTAGRPAGDPRRRLRGGARRRSLGLAHLPCGHAAAAAAGPAGRRRAEPDLRVQLVPDRVDAERPQPRLRPRHAHHVHVQDRLQERAARRGAGRRAGRGERGADARCRPRLPQRGSLARGRGLMRRVALAVLGQVVAFAVLAPYLVMLLTALKPEAELRTTPPRLLPVDWRPGNFLAVLGDPAFQDWL